MPERVKSAERRFCSPVLAFGVTSSAGLLRQLRLELLDLVRAGKSDGFSFSAIASCVCACARWPDAANMIAACKRRSGFTVLGFTTSCHELGRARMVAKKVLNPGERVEHGRASGCGRHRPSGERQPFRRRLSMHGKRVGQVVERDDMIRVNLQNSAVRVNRLVSTAGRFVERSTHDHRATNAAQASALPQPPCAPPPHRRLPQVVSARRVRANGCSGISGATCMATSSSAAPETGRASSVTSSNPSSRSARDKRRTAKRRTERVADDDGLPTEYRHGQVEGFHQAEALEVRGKQDLRPNRRAQDRAATRTRRRPSRPHGSDRRPGTRVTRHTNWSGSRDRRWAPMLREARETSSPRTPRRSRQWRQARTPSRRSARGSADPLSPRKSTPEHLHATCGLRRTFQHHLALVSLLQSGVSRPISSHVSPVRSTSASRWSSTTRPLFRGDTPLSMSARTSSTVNPSRRLTRKYRTLRWENGLASASSRSPRK